MPVIVHQTRGHQNYPRFLVMKDEERQPIIYSVDMFTRVSDDEAKKWYEDTFGPTVWVN